VIHSLVPFRYTRIINTLIIKFQEKETNCLIREIQAQECKTAASETTMRHIVSEIGKKRTELHSKNILYIFIIAL